MSIVPEEMQTGKNRVKLIGTSDTFVRVAIQGIEADREGHREIVELLHKARGQLRSVRNQREAKSYLNSLVSG